MAKERDIEQELDVVGGMETRTRIYLDGADVDGVPLVDKTEYTDIGLGGMSESVDIRLRQAGCRHALHVGAEIGGTCTNPACQAILCKKCASEYLCAECHRPVCGSCQKKIWLRADDSVLCPACARRFWIREFLLDGAAVVLLFLLFSLLL